MEEKHTLKQFEDVIPKLDPADIRVPIILGTPGGIKPTNPHWKKYCKSCKRSHIVSNQSCPSCGVHQTPQPVSESVQNTCKANYECDGCEAYRDHQH